jgi:hypothetical protein
MDFEMPERMDVSGLSPSAVRTESESHNDNGAIPEESTVRLVEEDARPSAESYDEMDAGELFADDDFILLDPSELLMPELLEVGINPRRVDGTLSPRQFARFAHMNRLELHRSASNIPPLEDEPELDVDATGPFTEQDATVPSIPAIIYY